MTSETSPAGVGPRVTVLDFLRLVSELVAFAALAVWGAFAWPMPWAVVWGIAAPLAAIVVWGVFLSPKAVIRLPRLVRAVIELIVFVSATLALWALELAWAGIAVGVFCVAVGVAVLRRDTAA